MRWIGKAMVFITQHHRGKVKEGEKNLGNAMPLCTEVLVVQ